jgi:hypothetical protein
VRLRASSLDCRMSRVLSTSQFRSPSSTSSEDRWGAINSHMVSRGQLGAEGGHSKRQQWETCFWKGAFLKVEAQIVWVKTWIVRQNSAGYLCSRLQHHPLWQFYLGGKC